MTVVKICGIMSADDAETAARAGAGMIGLVFADSRRQVEAPAAEVIVASLKKMAPDVKTVGVFVNESADRINAIAEQCHLDYAQLSGTESNELIEELDLPAIRTLHVGTRESGTELEERISATKAEIVLLDTRADGRYGGTGQTFNWQLVPKTDKKVMLAGGLNAANVAEAVSLVKPWGIDVSSGVEVAGRKDRMRMREFIGTTRLVDAKLAAR